MSVSSSDPPPELAYEDVDDWYNRSTLESNGVDTSEAGLVAALRGSDDAVRPLAAHELGVVDGQAGLEALAEAARDHNDQVRLQAAWSLARRGRTEGTDMLLALTEGPSDVSTVPLVAAGYLARLGHPDGFPSIRQGVSATNFLLRIVATKQLYFFVPLQTGGAGESGVDSIALYRLALSDEQEEVRWSALYQLSFLPRAVGGPLLTDFIETNTTGWLSAEARRIAAQMERDTTTS